MSFPSICTTLIIILIRMKELFYKILAPFSDHLKPFQKLLLETRFYSRYKRRIQWKHPISFFDKIIWMSCNADTSLWTWLADKYQVREYVEKKCGANLLTQLYGAYHKSSEINYDLLPQSFVLKTNNGCTSNILVKNKSQILPANLNKKLDYWMQYPYGELTGQLHYAAIPPRIIAEELLQQKDAPDAPLIDYKFYCFNGVPKYCFVISHRKFNTHNIKKMIYDMDWNPCKEFFPPTDETKDCACPTCFEEMKKIACTLAEGINFVRVDLYEVNGKVKFGEMTFMPGWDTGITEKTLLSWGKLFDEKQLITASEMRKRIHLQ